jgi:hypothetical protein
MLRSPLACGLADNDLLDRVSLTFTQQLVLQFSYYWRP